MIADHRIDISELVLRIPGVAREDVPALVDDVLRQLQDRLRGSTRAGDLHVAELTVRVPSSGGRSALIAALVDGLEGALR